MVIVIALVLLVASTVIFHYFSPWWLAPIASNWGNIDITINITTWITGAVFVAVNLFMAYAIYRYRFSPERRSHYDPENKKVELWLAGLTTVGIAAMLAPGLVVWAKFVEPPEDSAQVEVVGKQWHWMYRFPGDDGTFGDTHARFTSEDNPLGLDPSDPAAQDDILIFNNILHLPIQQPVELLLRSQDVIHNFAIPQFRAKMDMVPGMISSFWLEPKREGEFDVVCMILCGMGHYAMRGTVVVEPETSFTQWLDSHPTFADTQTASGNPQVGQGLYAVCASCHGPQGQGNESMNAPKLSGLEDWYLERQLQYFQEGIRGAHKDDIYGQQMAGMMATLPNDQAIADVVAYIETLPDEAAPDTIEGDASRGKALYENCSGCHGEQGQGNYATNAPQLAGQHDWYIIRQLQNFSEGIRGRHNRDYYGKQMMMMARTLHSDQAREDIASYINSL